jgi:tRNA pseudouridine13 synthase
MFGHALRPAAGEALAREAALLAAEGISLADFARGGGEAEGTRRAARLPVAAALDPLPDGYLARFELPGGSYATVVMRELMKVEEADLPEEGA